MAERHVLTTEERRRGAYAAAEAKRRKKRAVEQRVVELRAQRKVDGQNNRLGPVRPLQVEPENRPQAATGSTAEPRSTYYPPELTCPHGVCALDCEWCGRGRWKE